MTHEQELREISDRILDVFPHTSDRLSRIADELEALKAREPMTAAEIDIVFAAHGWSQSEIYHPVIRDVESHHNITSKG